jgi:excisionase family DNA binding protein
MPDITSNKEFLTTSQAARLLSVSPDTVLKWVKAGKIKSRRTLGGHFRIPISELQITSRASDTRVIRRTHPESSEYMYCWEYLAAGDEVKAGCKECITYRSRSKRCYELRDLPDGLGCISLQCEASCADCDYYKLVSGQARNVLVITSSRILVSDAVALDREKALNVRFAASEYEASQLIQSFRPDYIVVDCSLGKRRTAVLCTDLFNDDRIPVARIILSSREKILDEYCELEVFGWIKKPFTIRQLKVCIQSVPGTDGMTEH